MINKKNIAKEWLLLISCVMISAIITPMIYFVDSSSYEKNRRLFYDSFIEINESGLFKKTYPTFGSFSDSLDKQGIQKVLNDSSFKLFQAKIRFSGSKTDEESSEMFQKEFSKPSIVSGYPKFIDHLFSENYWFETWLAVLLPYISIQLIRSIIISLKIAFPKKQVAG